MDVMIAETEINCPTDLDECLLRSLHGMFRFVLCNEWAMTMMLNPFFSLITEIQLISHHCWEIACDVV